MIHLGRWKIWLKKKIFDYLHKNKKKAGVTAVIVLLTLGIVTASYGYYQSNIQTVYRVYINEKAVGVVNEKAVVNQWISEYKQEQKAKYPNVSIILDKTITFQEEEKYKPKWNNTEVLSALSSTLSIKAQGVKVIVDGETVGYVKDEKTANQIMDHLKSNYVEKEKKERKKSTVTTASVSSDTVEQRQVQKIAIQENVSFDKAETKPEQVVSHEEMETLLKKGTLENITYQVRKGDTLSEIAYKYDLSLEDVIRNNPDLLEESVLQIGQKLNVTAYQPKVTIRSEEKVIKLEKIGYDVEVRRDNSMFYGESKVLQPGEYGKKRVQYQVIKQNGIEVSTKTIDEEVIKQPVRKIIAKGTKIAPSKGSGRFQWPVYGGIITSNYGWRWGDMHSALDIAKPSNLSILASDSGSVVLAGWDGGYGNSVVIDHGNGYKTRYAHMRSLKVSKGQKVGKGQLIGIMGTTGYSTGVHLHFEIMLNGRRVNPLNYVSR